MICAQAEFVQLLTRMTVDVQMEHNQGKPGLVKPEHLSEFIYYSNFLGTIAIDFYSILNIQQTSEQIDVNSLN